MILLDKQGEGIIAEGDPRRLARRDHRPAGASVLPPRAGSCRLIDLKPAMSLRANYFKLGLFVDRCGRLRASSADHRIGSGRWFQPRRHDRDVFQRIGAGSRRRIQAQVSRRGHRRGDQSIGFTYNKYQQDKPMPQRDALRARRGADPAEAARRPRRSGLTSPAEIRNLESRSGLRMRLAPQGSPGRATSRSTTSSRRRRRSTIDWTPDNVYIPSAPSTVTTVVNAAIDILTRLHKHRHRGDARQSRTSCCVDQRERSLRVDTKDVSQRAAPGTRQDGSVARQPRDQEALRRGCRAARRASRDERAS